MKTIEMYHRERNEYLKLYSELTKVDLNELTIYVIEEADYLNLLTPEEQIKKQYELIKDLYDDAIKTIQHNEFIINESKPLFNNIIQGIKLIQEQITKDIDSVNLRKSKHNVNMLQDQINLLNEFIYKLKPL